MVQQVFLCKYRSLLHGRDHSWPGRWSDIRPLPVWAYIPWMAIHNKQNQRWVLRHLVINDAMEWINKTKNRASISLENTLSNKVSLLQRHAEGKGVGHPRRELWVESGAHSMLHERRLMWPLWRGTRKRRSENNRQTCSPSSGPMQSLWFFTQITWEVIVGFLEFYCLIWSTCLKAPVACCTGNTLLK